MVCNIFKLLRGTIFLAVIFLLVGCSSGGNPVETLPQIPDEQLVTGSNPNQDNESEAERDPASERFLLDYGLIYLNTENPNEIEAEIIPLREGFLHLNILKILEVMPCTNCFRIVGFDFPEPDVLDVDIEITHPFSDLDLSIFDVRAIMMFGGSKTFPASGLTISDTDLGDGFLINADGLTTLFNGNTIDAPTGDYFKYFPGNFSTPAVPNSDLNGYVYYATDDPGMLGDCAEVMTMVAQVEPDLVAPYAELLPPLLDHSKARVRWESMHALSQIAGIEPKLIEKILTKIDHIIHNDKSVIAKDCAVRAVSNYAGTGKKAAKKAYPILMKSIPVRDNRHAHHVIKGLIEIAHLMPETRDKLEKIGMEFMDVKRGVLRKAARKLLRVVDEK